ncbi:MAG: hypothetical protein WCT39_06685 [Candidatus Margulisiibacteriota bacterium]
MNTAPACRSGRQKKYSVADIYAEATRMLQDEMQELKNRPLNVKEAAKMQELGKTISKLVLKEMKVI